MLKPWEHLTFPRRGWAVGSIFGLIITTLYLFLYGTKIIPVNSFYFIFLTIPTLPGILFAEQIIPYLQLHFPFKVRFVYALLVTTGNYFFWGGVSSFIFRLAHRVTLRNLRTPYLAFVILFFGVASMAYSLGRGIRLRALSVDLIILLVGLMLCLFSMTTIYAYLLDNTK